jgi:hypothetical protein
MHFKNEPFQPTVGRSTLERREAFGVRTAEWHGFAILLAAIACTAFAAQSNAASLYAPASSCELRRAGCPQNVSPVAVPSNRPSDVGYYVGGGAWTCRSTRQCADQGTWGWDYQCRYLPPIVRLGWWRHPHEQGGTGSYQPDGPTICHE